MKTVLFSSIAATALLFGASTANAGDSPSLVAKASPLLSANPEAYEWGENSDIASAVVDGSGYEYQGKWEGEFVDPQMRVFQGQWNGQVVRHGDRLIAGNYHDRPDMDAPYPDFDEDYDDEYYDDGYQPVRREHENHERFAYRHPHASQYQDYGWQGGYYYQQAPMITTVTVVPGFATTTVTEEITYETVYTTPRRKAARKWKPKPKPRCVCR